MNSNVGEMKKYVFGYLAAIQTLSDAFIKISANDYLGCVSSSR